MKKTINILGVTGSVGQCAVDVILSAPDKFDVQVVTAHKDTEKLAALAVKLEAKHAVVADEKQKEALSDALDGTNIAVSAGRMALEEAAGSSADITLAAIVGIAGLKPVMAAISGSDAVAIANKEPLVAAGPLVMAAARKYGTKILPVDSEHNAVFQVFESGNRAHIEKIILTASGGPFRTWSAADMAQATPEQALAHPNWSMGPKISVDSATMMNKALEIIEAHYLFEMPVDKIEVLVHPQSVVHSMVAYADGSILAQMGASDMRTPVAHALAWPERMKTPGRVLSFKDVGTLTFDSPDFDKFPALGFARKALKQGEYACVALNAANEVGVDSFLRHRIGFHGIIESVDYIFSGLQRKTLSTLDEVERYDRSVREEVTAYIGNLCNKGVAETL